MQARAHRLGQKKPVFTYRFVTRATVEERIMQRAKQKRVLEEVVIGKQNLGQEELQSILEYGAAELFADNDQAAERRITYDDAALEALLDRAKRLAEKDDHEADDVDLMEAFKVRCTFVSTLAFVRSYFVSVWYVRGACSHPSA
jgi:hypothetical protein